MSLSKFNIQYSNRMVLKSLACAVGTDSPPPPGKEEKEKTAQERNWRKSKQFKKGFIFNLYTKVKLDYGSAGSGQFFDFERCFVSLKTLNLSTKPEPSLKIPSACQFLTSIRLRQYSDAGI